jgi:Ca2+-transporting ATPase
MDRWHQMDSGEVLEALRTSDQGLSSNSATALLKQFGPNQLEEKQKKTIIMMFLDQFRDFMILVLIFAAIISGVIGELSDTIAIVVIVVLNAVIGFVQEFRAEKALAALKKMAAPTANVFRDGVLASIPSEQVVPGDIVLLEAGAVLPADLRLLEVHQLKVEEAALTGESVPVEKEVAALPDDVPIAERKNMAFKGTIASYGRGRGVVVTTGMRTELGRIATMLQEEEEVKTPLQKRLARFSKNLAVIVLIICAIVFGVGVLRGEPVLLMFLTAISLAVAAIPEALPAVVTISLALGARKLVKQNALIRKLPAVETLGSVTFICSDKTGTLTQNKMRVEEIYAENSVTKTKELRIPAPEGYDCNNPTEITFCNLFLGMAISNDAIAGGDGTVMGDPTETALYTCARERGFAKEEMIKMFPRVSEIPFDSERKCMTTFHEITGEWQGFQGKSDTMKIVSFTKGAAEVLLARSNSVLTSDGLQPVDHEEINRVNERMASDGLRVLCIAMRHWPELPDDLSPEYIEKELTILGLIAMIDPPREEVKDAVTLCKTAGITPVMITGDHPVTARAIARQLGIVGDGMKAIINGRDLEAMPLEEFEEKVQHLRVYARVAPEQKLKIVKALQDKNQFVAMTGDGVNDAPALKRADIGIAMGITGTDVSKEASHMVLLDDNFATIVRAVKEGRRIFDNIRKFIQYTMTSNSGEIWTIFLAPFLGLPIPLLPIHILWINLVTDGLPGLALAAESAEKGIMNRPPRQPQESIFSGGLGVRIFLVGLFMGFVCIFTQAWSIRTGDVHWQTMVFTVLCLSQMGNVLALRSESESLFKQGMLSNKPLFGAFLLTLVLQLATIYIPVLNKVFKTHPLSFWELMIAFGLSSIVFFAMEAEKLIRRMRDKKAMPALS